MSLPNKRKLRKAVLAIEALSDPQVRQGVLRELRREIGTQFDPNRFSTAGADSWELLATLIEFRRMRTFVDVIALFDDETDQWRALSDLVNKLFPSRLLLPSERDALAGLLESVPSDAVAGAMIDAELDPELASSHDVVRTAAEVLDLIDSGISDGVISPDRLWIYLESLAHRAETVADDLHLEVNAAAVRLEAYDDVRQVCRMTVSKLTVAPSNSTRTSREVDDTLQSTSTHSGAEDMAAVAPSKVTTKPAVMRGLPPRNAYFSGRAEVLNGIKRALESKSTAAVLPHTLHGLGGVGKSQVAVEYAYRNQSEYELIFWIPADDEQAMRRSLMSLGRALEIQESNDAQYMIDNTLDELRSGRKYSKWLLIFDNASEPSTVRPYLPGGDGHVLITSRSQSWQQVSTFVEVSVFSKSESREFLNRRWPDLPPDRVDELAAKLDHLPLALSQAAAFHAETGMPLAEYLDNYDQLVAAVTETTPSDYPQPVAVTWRLAFDRLTEKAPAAAQLLQLCCFLSSEPIAVPMLRSGRGADLPKELKLALQNEFEFRKAVKALGQFALAQIDTKRDFITVHSLVRAVMRVGLDEAQRQNAERNAHEVLALANPGEPDRGETWGRHAQIAPHVLASGIMHSDVAHVRQVILDQVRYFFAIGDFESSRRLAEQAVENWKGRLGPDEVMTLRTRFHLGNALRTLGDHKKAHRETQEAYVRLEKTLGPDDLHTLAVANSLGADLRFVGDFSKALTQDTDTLDRHRRVLGDGDMSTIRAANNVAVDLRLLGDFEAARTIDADNVRRRIEADPESSDPDTLGCISNLVRDLIGLGRYKEALETQEERLAHFESRLKAHRLLFFAHRNQAIIYRKLGRFDVALAIAESEERTTRQLRGPRHDNSLGAAITLVNTLRACGDHAEARLRGEETYELYQSVFGPDHPFTLACAVDLAIVYRGLGRNDEATALDEHSVVGLRQKLGPDHPFTLSAAANHANDLAYASKPEDALKIAKDVLSRSTRVRGPNHPHTLLAAANLALDLESSGANDEAQQLRARTLQVLRRVLGPDHPETASVERSRERRLRAETDIEVPPL